MAPGMPLRAQQWVVAITLTAQGTTDTIADTCAAQVCRLVRLMRIGAQVILPGSGVPETIPLGQLVALHRIVLQRRML